MGYRCETFHTGGRRIKNNYDALAPGDSQACRTAPMQRVRDEEDGFRKMILQNAAKNTLLRQENV